MNGQIPCAETASKASKESISTLKLNCAHSFSAESRRAILKTLGSSLWEAEVELWAEAGNISIQSAQRLKVKALAFNAEEEFRLAETLGAKIIFGWDAAYPEILKSIPDAPLALYVFGEIGAVDSLAIVGSRNPTPYGRRMAARFAADSVESGLVVVSGLARGIDTEAHRAAISHFGKTWAVLGSGLNCIYPSENKALVKEIVASGGAVISEFPLQAEPCSEFFPLRNRIISGLSWGVIVVEGRARSGSLITARRAAEQGRAIFAVPGPIDSPLSEAPHALISKGAKLAASFEDILEELPPSCRHEEKRALKVDSAPHKILPALSFIKRKILEFIGSGSRSLEEIGRESGLDLSELSSSLFELEVDGWIAGEPGQRYAIKKRT